MNKNIISPVVLGKPAPPPNPGPVAGGLPDFKAMFKTMSPEQRKRVLRSSIMRIVLL